MPASRKPAETAPPRLKSLAKLPVFFDLAGKRAVVAGGTAAAAWKAELIAAAGANVDVYANELAPEMSDLLARGAASGTITLHAHTWSADAVSGAAIAIADVDSETEAAAFVDSARSAGVPFNVIDKPAYCQFQIGTIVNRSPVVVGISTDGAAPILGQAIRRRIEAVLPSSLGDWGRLAKALRNDVAARLPVGPLRRCFWERLAERAFGPPPGAHGEIRLRASLQGLAEDIASERGSVTLVGAGPGDAELLTLKAVRALQSADVILYDDLVSGDVLELARREARRICVGKRGHRKSCRQDDINDLMISLAREGRHVVRLKSGDPAIFGRAGEEIARLTEAGIPVEMVPGITAASGMAARLGLSLTHRDGAQSVRFVTAHGRHGSLPEELDWRGLADTTTTLVIYMGGRIAGAFARRLLDQGLPPATPVAAVAGVSHPDERRWAGTLGDMASGRLILAAGAAPVIIGIGKVFASASLSAEHKNSAETCARVYPVAGSDGVPVTMHNEALPGPARWHPQSDRHQAFEPV